MDNFTKHLIYQLQSDCRQSTSTLAKKLFADRSTVKKYITELESNKIIQSYSVLLDYRSMGYLLQVDFFIKVSPEYHDPLFETLKKIPEISHLLFLSGDHDLLAVALFHNINELDDFLVKKLSPLPGIRSITSGIVLSHYHQKTPMETPTINKNFILSEFDQKILFLLRKYGKISYIDLAKRLNSTKQTIYYHIQRLIEKKIIRKFTTLIDYKKLGYSFNTLIILEVELSMFHAVLEQLETIDEIFWINTLAPTRSFLINVIFSDRSGLNDFLDHKIAPIQGIKGIEINLVLRDFIRYYV